MTTFTFRVASAVLAITTMLTVATVSADAGPNAADAKKALVKPNKQMPPRGGASNVQAALTMKCHDSVYFAPKNGGYLNVVAMPNPGNPAIATATYSVSNYRPAGRVRPGGTDGGIEVTSGGPPGGTTMITYVLENFEGEQVTVDLTVTVDCTKPTNPKKKKKQKKISWEDGNPDPPIPGPDPLPPSNVPPKKATLHTNHIPTHRETTCTPCRQIAAQLNAVIDKLSTEMQVSSNGSLVGPESAATDYQQYQVLLAALEACERSCPPNGQTTGYIDPPFIVIIDGKHDDEYRKREGRKDEYRKDEPKKSDISRTNPATSDRKSATVGQEKAATADARKSATATRESQAAKVRPSMSRQMRHQGVNASRFSAPRQKGFGGPIRRMASSPSHFGGIAPHMGSFSRMGSMGGMHSLHR
jgi:hypothetical protein